MHRYAALLIAAGGSLAAHAADVVAPRPDPRPVALVAGLKDGPLKRELAACTNHPVRRTSFSLGHRGAPLHYPEHTRESYVAAAAMGAGIIECDVTFTSDKQLVCRHAQDDLHTTTDILLTPLAARCKEPFRPAQFDAQGTLLAPAAALCRTSDITLAEFRTLRGKRDGFDPRAHNVEEYVWGGKAAVDALGPSTGTLMSHSDSIALFRQLGVQMVPELKQPVVAMPYDGMSQQQFAQRLIDDYKAAGVPSSAVWPQSFNLDDILYWIEREPDSAGRRSISRTPKAQASCPTPPSSSACAHRASASGRRRCSPCWRSTTAARSSRPQARAMHGQPDSNWSRGAWSAPARSVPARTVGTTRPSIPPCAVTATCCRCSTSWQGRFTCAPCSATGPPRPPSTQTAPAWTDPGDSLLDQPGPR